MTDIDFDEVLGSPKDYAEAWHRFGLQRNPFPARANPVWDVLHNQESVRAQFLRELQEFVHAGTTTTMLILGGNRVGKTHFMEFFRRRLPREMAAREQVLPIALVSAQHGDFRQLYVNLVEQIDESLNQQLGEGLFQQAPPSGEYGKSLPPGDFRRALDVYWKARPAQRADVGLLLRKWIRGERIHASQRKHLEVRDNVDSVGQFLSVMEGLVAYLRWLGEQPGQRRCPGILLFVDEFELLWRQRRDRRDQFMQNARAYRCLRAGALPVRGHGPGAGHGCQGPGGRVSCALRPAPGARCPSAARPDADPICA